MRSSWSLFIESPLVKSMLDDAGRRGIPSKAEERALIAAAQGGDADSRTELAIRHCPFVVMQVKRMGGWGVDYADMFQEGMIGLDKAIDRFNPDDHQNRFISYAVWWINQSMLLSAQESAGAMRVPVNRHPAMIKIRKLIVAGKNVDVFDVMRMFKITKPVAQALLDNSMPALSLNAPTKQTRGEYDELELLYAIPQEFNDDVADADEVRWAVSLIEGDHKMTAREKHVVVARIFHGRTLDDIATDFGLSRERIRQIEAGAMTRVRRLAREYDERCGFTRDDRLQMLNMGG